MNHILEINDIRDLDSYRELWWSLLERTPGANFFQTLEWLEVYWKHCGRGQKLRVLVVGDAQQPLGILPLVERSEQRRVGKIRVLTYPLDDWGSFYGPLGDRGIETLRAGLDHVLSTRRRWDLLDVRWAPPAGLDPAESADVMRLVGIEPRTSVREQTAVIDLVGTWEEFLAGRSSKWRNNFRRWKKRLHEAGTVRHERYRPQGAAHGETDPRWDLFDQCQQLAETSWQGSSKTGTTISHAAIRNYIRDTHEAAARAGCLDVNLLYVDERPIAFGYNYHFRGTLFGLRIGYDPAMNHVSPGNMMYAAAIEDCFRRGDTQYDMGPGSLDCKRYFWSRVVPVMQHTYYHPLGFRAQLIRLKGAIQDRWQARQAAASSPETIHQENSE